MTEKEKSSPGSGERFKGMTLSEVISQQGIHIAGRSLKALTAGEEHLHQGGNNQGIIFDLSSRYLAGESLKQLAGSLGLGRTSIRKLFASLGLPVRSQAEAVRANWQDPEFRQRQADAVRANWQDPEFRQRNAEAVRANWQDPEFRQRNAEAVRANWQDPEFRQRNTEATRQARLNPANLSRYKLPTIHGLKK